MKKSHTILRRLSVLVLAVAVVISNVTAGYAQEDEPIVSIIPEISIVKGNTTQLEGTSSTKCSYHVWSSPRESVATVEGSIF